MVDLARLQIRIESLEAEVAERRLDSLGRTGRRTERATDSLASSFKRLVGPLTAAVSAASALSKLLTVARQFDVLNAQLITATGSAENAAVAFEAIQDFASQTPFDLAQVTDAFVKLTNLGLTPSRDALTSYGNTASAMGKSLNQLIEAVADAATGEFERLKEFGIRSSSEGDRVSFTFRGVTTTVGKNAAEIEGYLKSLGENEFAGAMEERVKTLDGAISNLGDAWDNLFLSVSRLGVSDLIETGVREATAAISDLTDALESGEFEARVTAIGDKFDGFGQDVASVLDTLSKLWSEFLGTSGGQGIVGATTESTKAISGAFLNLPENLRSAVQLLTVELASLVDAGRVYGGAFAEVIGINLAKLAERGKATAASIADAFNPFSSGVGDLSAELQRLDDVAAEATDEVLGKAASEIERLRTARRESITSIIDEREAALKSFDDQIKAAESLREKYDAAIKVRKESSDDPLAQFKTGGDGGGERESAAKIRAREKEFENLRLSLRTEEEVIQESFDRRLAIILKNTKEGSDQRRDLEQRLQQDFATEALGDLGQPNTPEDEIASLQSFYERRRELILSNSQLTEEQRTELEERLTKERNERIAQLEEARLSMLSATASALFSDLAGLSKEFAGEQSDLYRGLFAVSKAFAIADSVVKIQSAIAGAFTLPYPANLTAAATVASETGGILSTIRGTSLPSSGAFDNGGVIPQGRVGLVGEFGPELVAGPANVRSRRETAEMFRGGEGQNPAPPPVMQNNVRIVNSIDPQVVEDYVGSSRGEQIIMNVIRSNPETIRAVVG